LSVLLARAQLFAAIEGGSVPWNEEILKIGPIEVRNRLCAGAYKTASKAAERINQTTGEEVLAQITKAGAFILTPEDVDWPQSLNDLAAPPIALLIKGQRENLTRLENSISIVGTRNPTSYGARIAGDFGVGVADHEWAVVSGGAIGIDAAAHKGCLVGEGITVAIHERLFAEICESGILISEVMPDVPAIPHRFLTRNRLIAGLSKATVVVEAAFRSGSLRTARDAAEIFRPVMAVPGPITAPTSEGCHRLIVERVAELVTSVSEIMELVKPINIK
jgi:DNA processing protein